ncbi:serine/threonine protein kinase [Mastigocladus laminosus UU774]|nr:serine/threonine protein kinase [Mastigocladus laminosus UU774]
MQTLLNNRYQVIQTLGGGGFGETFLAEDTQMPSRRRCVIKQLKPIQDNPQVYQLVQQRFQREAAILEELGDGSDQIPRLYAYFSENGQFYLVQEYIQGQTLTAKMQQQGLMSESTVKEILTSILPVLDYVHSKGIVHRDIKPDNILIRYADGKPILIDFGAVKETVGTVMTPSGNSTKSIVIGTPGFMPSEQTVGRPMFASDIYSLGLTAIYLITGKVPQELGTDPATGGVLWREHALNVTPTFAAILDKAIQFYASDRFVSAKEMLQALHTGTAPFPPTVPYTPPTVPYQPPPAATVPYPQTPQNTVAVSPANSYQPPTNQNTGNGNGNRGILIGSIVGSLIGASIIISFALGNRQQPQPINQQPTISPSEPATASVEPEQSPKLLKPTPTPTPESNFPITSESSSETVEPQETVSPEPSPDSNTTEPIPTQTPTPEETTATNPENTRPSPEEFIQTYYATINQGQYQTAWYQLSPNYQNNKRLHPNGYLSYIDWWGGKVQQVEVEQVSLIESNTETAIVSAQLKYILKTGNESSSSINFSLLWDAENNKWVIADTK